MLKSLFWIGATGVALVAGIALHHGDDIARAGHEISVNVERFKDVGGHFEREFDAAERAVDEGADAETTYEDAVASALISSGLVTLENIEDIDSQGERSLVVSDRGDRFNVDVDDVIARARAKLEEAREAGEIIEGRGVSGSDINDVLEALDELEALDGNSFNIEIQ